MEIRRLGRTGLKVSALCLGTMTFGWSVDEPTSHSILSTAFDAGINFIDTADIYVRWAGKPGISEKYIGSWLRGQARDQLVIATKVRGPMGNGPNDQGLSRRYILYAVEASLRRLGTEYIDLYQTHWPDDETPLDETLRAMDDLVRAGKVRYLGCSNIAAWILCKSLWVSERLGLIRYDSLQPHYNLVHRAEFERELRPLCQDQEIGVIPYSPLAGGFLTGKYRREAEIPSGSRGQSSERIQRLMTEQNFVVVDRLEAIARNHGKTISQTALAWLLADPVITSPIIGATSVQQLQESLGAMDFRLSPEEKAELDSLTAWQER